MSLRDLLRAVAFVMLRWLLERDKSRDQGDKLAREMLDLLRGEAPDFGQALGGRLGRGREEHERERDGVAADRLHARVRQAHHPRAAADRLAACRQCFVVEHGERGPWRWRSSVHAR